MTDKQIIIYKKECYNEPYCSLNQVLEQLKRKEQECERLKIYIESNEQQVKEVEKLVMDNDRLINELDQLKAELEAYKMEAEEGKEINAELKATNEDLLSIQYKLADNNKQLRQTLTEIKEIAEDESYIGFWDEQISKILQICGEVKE